MTYPIVGAGADCHISIDRGSAAEAVVRRSIGEVNLLNITEWGEILGTLEYLNDAGPTLTDPAAVVEVVETLVWIDPCRQSRFAQIGAFDATDLLAFLLKTDGGHGSITLECRLIYKLRSFR